MLTLNGFAVCRLSILIPSTRSGEVIEGCVEIWSMGGILGDQRRSGFCNENKVAIVPPEGSC